jgi:PAS domain S-box-containing protein
VVFRDITERKRLARMEDEAAAQVRAILAHAPDGVIVESGGRVVYANARMAEMLGYDSAEQVVGRPGAEFEWPDERPRLAEYDRLRREGKPAPLRYTASIRTRDGGRRKLDATVTSYREGDRIFVLAFLRPAPD